MENDIIKLLEKSTKEQVDKFIKEQDEFYDRVCKKIENINLDDYDKYGNELNQLPPSNETKKYWIHAQGTGKGCYENNQTYVGKWLIFISEQYINDIWNKIKIATNQEELSIGSKVSTKRQINEKIASNYVICIYTEDYRDKENVKYVLQQLRKIGIIHILYYKADSTTLQGIYSSNTPLTKKIGKASIYCSKEFEPDKYQRTMMDY